MELWELSFEYQKGINPLRNRARFLSEQLEAEFDEQQRKILIRRIDLLRAEMEQLEEIAQNLRSYQRGSPREKRRPK